jgi:hypothetical protein
MSKIGDFVPITRAENCTAVMRDNDKQPAWL